MTAIERIEPDSNLYPAKGRVIIAVRELIAAEWHAEAYPEAAHGADGIDYCDDQLDAALLAFARTYVDPHMGIGVGVDRELLHRAAKRLREVLPSFRDPRHYSDHADRALVDDLERAERHD